MVGLEKKNVTQHNNGVSKMCLFTPQLVAIEDTLNESKSGQSVCERKSERVSKLETA